MTPDPQICCYPPTGIALGLHEHLPLASLAAQAPLPALITIPIALITMIFIAGHVMAMNEPNSGVPTSRKRIRSTTGVMLMWLVALVAYAISILNPDHTSEFVLTWLTIISVVGLVIILALLDVLNTIRLHATARKIIREELKDGISAALQQHTASTKITKPKLAHSNSSTTWGRNE